MDIMVMLPYAREEGLEIGCQEGRQEEKKESAIKMLKKGFDVKMISEILERN